MKIKAYSFDADVFCPCCTKRAWREGDLKPDGRPEAVIDCNGIPEDLIDSEGNPIHPIFSVDEVPEEGLYCGACREEIEPPLCETADFDRFSLKIASHIVRECSAQGSCDSAVEWWVDRAGIDWDKIDAKEIREELEEYGAWSLEDLEDEEENRRRIFWIACGNIKESRRA